LPIDIAAVNDENAALRDTVSGKAEKGVALPGAPLRRDIARRHNKQNGGRPADRLHDLRGERMIAIDVVVDPDPEILGAEPLPDLGV
jgi:hypothetical protein